MQEIYKNRIEHMIFQNSGHEAHVMAGLLQYRAEGKQGRVICPCSVIHEV